ncbi:hypothetical protein GSI_13317 [Ganoderma sinense ZZ0214-1]|uniref:HAT C-terminal dimerisation domain-containing protein n=1 Tax=Ganoderma sinense ZZ0214-1 TaxID=1077348 RepID=A0A2G8RV90_9APHY|nr:hypothetical protein GSI_13317 [Ganoderma sinense ZZ0214-1]
MFKEHPGRVHLSVDGWTSPNVFSFLGITAHWIQNGELRHIILDFIKLTKSHTGRYLAEKLGECLRVYGIEEKLLAFTVDNAYLNPVMLEELADIIPGTRGTEVMVRCFGHVLNLIVKAALSQFSRKCRNKPRTTNTRGMNTTDADPQDDGDLDVLDEGLNAHGDVEEDLSNAGNEDEDEDEDAVPDKDREAVDEVILEALYDDEPDFVLSQDDIKAGRVALDKITALSNRVWHNPTIRAALAEKAGEEELNSEVLVRAVRTRWNTVTLLLERALDMRDTLEQVCDMAQFNDPPGRRPPRGSRARTSRLRRFILLDEEWEILASLYDLLYPFLFVTVQVSSSGRTLVHEVIPFMDTLTDHLDKFRNNDDIPPVVRAAAYRGRKILDKYYTFTDNSIIFHIAMILHPRYKLTYFHKQNWLPEWIDRARELVRTEWRTNYKPGPPAHPATEHEASENTGKGMPSRCPGRLSAKASASASAKALFADLVGRPDAANHDALEVYLEAPPLVTVHNPLEYWTPLLKSGPDAALARMALDFLSVPATSVEVERAFSRGRLQSPGFATLLVTTQVRASTLLGSWANIPGLVDETETVNLLSGSKKGKAAPDAGPPIASTGVGARKAKEVIEIESD